MDQYVIAREARVEEAGTVHAAHSAPIRHEQTFNMPAVSSCDVPRSRRERVPSRWEERRSGRWLAIVLLSLSAGMKTSFASGTTLHKGREILELITSIILACYGNSNLASFVCSMFALVPLDPLGRKTQSPKSHLVSVRLQSQSISTFPQLRLLSIFTNLHNLTSIPLPIIGVFASKPNFSSLDPQKKMAAKQFAEVSPCLFWSGQMRKLPIGGEE